MILSDILKDSNYKLIQFSEEQIKLLEDGIVLKEKNGKQVPYITCIIREKEIKLTPEEAIRELNNLHIKQHL